MAGPNAAQQKPRHASTNYKSIHQNDDGVTTSIVSPRFSAPGGKNLRISTHLPTSMDGICKLFGRDTFVAQSADLGVAEEGERTATINGRGEFAGYGGFVVIESLVCR